ncbi:MAG: hypothetical protein HN348_13990, partial [Proteobacteria bacterium]|nr:hypothetical protein [Pseudomonadota bacterium]
AGQLYDEIIKADPQSELAYFNAAILHERYTRDFNKALRYLQAYVDSRSVTPDDPVFAKINEVNAAKAADEERKRQEAERKRQEEERRKRNEELLKNMSVKVTELQGTMTAKAHCFDPDFADEVSMILEQAGMVVEMGEAEMAADIQTLLDGYIPSIEDSVAGCAEAPAPEAPPEGAELPPEDGELPEGAALPEGGEAPAGEETGGTEEPAPEPPPEDGGE